MSVRNSIECPVLGRTKWRGVWETRLTDAGWVVRRATADLVALDHRLERKRWVLPRSNEWIGWPFLVDSDEARVVLVDGNRIRAVLPSTGRTLWETRIDWPNPTRHRVRAAADGVLVWLVGPGPEGVRLDALDGKTGHARATAVIPVAAAEGLALWSGPGSAGTVVCSTWEMLHASLEGDALRIEDLRIADRLVTGVTPGGGCFESVSIHGPEDFRVHDFATGAVVLSIDLTAAMLGLNRLWREDGHTTEGGRSLSDELALVRTSQGTPLLVRADGEVLGSLSFAGASQCDFIHAVRPGVSGPQVLLERTSSGLFLVAVAPPSNRLRADSPV